MRPSKASASGAPEEGTPSRPDPQVWLYRGAWQEWPLHEADVFVPLSKADLDRKVEVIFKHESQEDRAMFPGGRVTSGLSTKRGSSVASSTTMTVSSWR